MSKQAISQLMSISDEDVLQLERLESELFPQDTWNHKALRNLLSKEYNHFFIMTLNNQIIGYCIVQVMFDIAEILRIGIDKDVQGQGFAKQILQDVIAFLQTTDSEKLLLEVRADNVSAIKLYQSFDFEQIHVRKNYYKNQGDTFTDALILQRDLV